MSPVKGYNLQRLISNTTSSNLSQSSFTTSRQVSFMSFDARLSDITVFNYEALLSPLNSANEFIRLAQWRGLHDSLLVSSLSHRTCTCTFNLILLSQRLFLCCFMRSHAVALYFSYYWLQKPSIFFFLVSFWK